MNQLPNNLKGGFLMIFKFNSKTKEMKKMAEDIYFDVVLASKRYPGGRDKVLVQAENIEEAVKSIRDQEGKVEENGVWVPRGAMVVGVGTSGYSGVLMKKSNLVTPST
jgi:hypothetical protein